MNNRTFESYPDVFSVMDFAKFLGIGKQTAYAEVHSGAIRHFKLGNKILIPKICVQEYLSAKTCA